MKNALIKHLSLTILVCMLFGMFVTSCEPVLPQIDTTTTTTTGGGSYVPPEDEYTIPKEEGMKQLTFYFYHKDNDYSKSDIWIWYDDVAGQGYLMHECDYGAKVVINVPESVSEVGFIVRRDCSEPGGNSWGTCIKDTSDDRFAVLEGDKTFIYLTSGDANQYRSNDGGRTLEIIKKINIAGIVDFHTIKYSINPKVKIESYDDIKLWEGDKQLTITNISSMGKVSSSGKLEIEEKLELNKAYRLEIAGYGEVEVVPTDIFDSDIFAQMYHYDGDDLGSYIHGDSTTFKVWAPTASKVVLNLYTSGHEGESFKDVEMKLGEKGVWEHTEKGVGHGTYYTYTVTTSVGTQTATDPYGKSAGLNGNRTMVIDLDLTDPEGWKSDDFSTGISSYSEAFVWEVHVRDFSNLIEDSQYKGKYLAFTESGLTNEAGLPVGIDYLKALGVTHVHLLPVYDYATVDEANPDEMFNWGYDPKNYNVPEGSYSTNPYDGEVRVREYKQMVQALHEAGIGVVMDVVYNHTYDANSSFNKIVPYYYYRYTNTGANSSASGCGNDTASERYMYGKFMVDSTSYWMEEYDLDGLRFDLMGLHDLETMKRVEAAVHSINPEAVIYGEGWTMGSTIDGTPQANQSNISQIKPTNNAIGSIAVFNDAIRDGLKGSTFDIKSQGYINGAGAANVTKIKFGIFGGTIGGGVGWQVENAMVVNYMSAHDNNTLWDKLILANGDKSVEDRINMNRLGAAILFVSKGMVFVQAGEEMLRSKPKGDGEYDENSYKSSDEINNIKWDALTPDSDEYKMMQYYAGLAAMRAKYSVFSDPNAYIEITEINNQGALQVYMKNDDGEAMVIINPSTYAARYTLEGDWNLVATLEVSGTETIDTKTSGSYYMGNNVLIFVK